MKNIILLAIAFLALNASAQSITFSNLPSATSQVTTLVSGDDVKNMSSIHAGKEKAEKARLQDYVEKELERKFMGVKCSESKSITKFSNTQGILLIGLQSSCTVSFL